MEEIDHKIYDIKDFFDEEYFDNKKVVYIPRWNFVA